MGEIVIGKNQDGSEIKISVPDEFLDIGYKIKEQTSNYVSQVSASGVTTRRLDQIISAFGLDTQGKKIKFADALSMAKEKINSSGDVETITAENIKLKEQIQKISSGDSQADELQKQVSELQSMLKNIETEKKKLSTEYESKITTEKLGFRRELVKTNIIQEAVGLGLHESEKADFGNALESRFDINIDTDDNVVKFINRQNGNDGYVTNKEGAMASAKDIAQMMKEMKPLVFAPPPAGAGTTGSATDGSPNTKGAGRQWDPNEK